MTVTIHIGDCREVLPTLPERSVQCVVTSPPYYALRSYLRADDPNKAREIGAEPAPDCLAWARGEPPCGRCYVCTMRAVFGAVWRVLRDDGVVWLNLGTSYAANNSGNNGYKDGRTNRDKRMAAGVPDGMAEKNLLGIPWRVALALQADGWVLRSDCIWAKPNAMPESVTDRPTKAHEYVFMLAKQARYFYDAASIAEAAGQPVGVARLTAQHKADAGGFTTNGHGNSTLGANAGAATRNARTVWTINTSSFSGAHFAVFPEALAERCVRAGSAAQACPTCGAAWVRVVEREGGTWEARRAEGAPMRYGVGSSKGTSSNRMGESAAITTGFSAGCHCPNNDGSARSVVLDPFAGSGTTLRVAERLGRDAIGIELNGDYTSLHDERLNGVQKEMAL